MSSDKVPQTIRFEEKTFKKLEELAKSDYTSVNSIVNRIVENYLKGTLNEVAGSIPAGGFFKILL